MRIVAAKDAGFTDKCTLASVHLNIFSNERLKNLISMLICMFCYTLLDRFIVKAIKNVVLAKGGSRL